MHAAKEDEPIKPTSPYAASKVAFDMYLRVGAQVPQVPDERDPALERLLPGTAAAPRHPQGDSLRPDRHQAAAAGRRPGREVLHPRARSGRAIHLVAEKAPLGKIYNAGPAEPTSIRRVVELCAEALGMPFEQLCEMAPDRLGQDSRYWLDSSAIKRDLGWEPQVGWNEGLREMVDWGRAHLDQLRRWPTSYTLRG